MSGGTLGRGVIGSAIVLACGCKPPGGGDGDGSEGPLEQATVSHFYGSWDLEPYEEAWPCVSWTLNNEESLYVNATTLNNEGMYHHSTWLVVPEDYYEGPDGFWDCDARGFSEVEAAVAGTVLIAQSTQSTYERQFYGDGVVVKIPPHHKIVAQNHMLNVANRPVTTGTTMSLELVHPKLVETVLVPFRLAYWDLHIPPMAESDHVADCELDGPFNMATGRDIDMKIHFLLPHTHDLGKRFYVDIVGGPRDGERVVDIEGFNARGNGARFDDPIDMTGATGLRMTCGYHNPRDEEIGWGFGDQEMCEMLGMADSDALIDMGVSGYEYLGAVDGVEQYGGACSGLGFAPNSKQTLPTQDEVDGELYLPPISEEDEAIDPVPKCLDFETGTAPIGPPTLSDIAATVFPSCTWSACHGGDSPAAGLDLASADLHAELLGHEVQADTADPLIAPGDPEGSWLYQRLALCDPTGNDGVEYAHMPLGNPVLLDAGLIAKVRAWIEDGAKDD